MSNAHPDPPRVAYKTGARKQRCCYIFMLLLCSVNGTYHIHGIRIFRNLVAHNMVYLAPVFPIVIAGAYRSHV